MKLKVAILTTLLTGCSATLRPDPSPVAADSNYPTAEFYVQGKMFQGLGEVSITRGMPLSDIKLEVQGYYQGIIHVDSAICGVSTSWSYADSQRISIPLQGHADQSCLIDVVVSVVYPKRSLNEQLTYEFKGQLLIKVLDLGQAWVGYSTKLGQGKDAKIDVLVKTKNTTRVAFRGCNIGYDKEVQVVNDSIAVSFNEVAPATAEKRCSLEGFVKPTYPYSTPTRISWRVWRYDEKFIPLALPYVTIGEYGHLEVTGEPVVSVVALDEVFKIGSSAEFYFTEDQPHTLRLLTIKGRSVVCLYTPPISKDWACLN